MFEYVIYFVFLFPLGCFAFGIMGLMLPMMIGANISFVLAIIFCIVWLVYLAYKLWKDYKDENR